jgi:ubiquinone/menaquinone biosynthesis C-methylase UbiE
MRPPPLTPLAAAVLHVAEPERALQVECGEGEGVLFLAREFPRARVRGVDRSEQAIAAARRRVGLDPEGRVAFKVGSPRSLPFPDQHFDLLAQLASRPAPGEAARVLRPGGYLVLASTGARRDPVPLRRRWLWRRLSKAGFALERAEQVSGGSFLIARRRGEDRAPGSI